MSWACGVCSTRNEGTTATCVACGAAQQAPGAVRPSVPAVPVVAAPPASPSAQAPRPSRDARPGSSPPSITSSASPGPYPSTPVNPGAMATHGPGPLLPEASFDAPPEGKGSGRRGIPSLVWILMALLVLGGAVAGVMVGLSAGDVDDGRVEITDTPRQSETSLRGEARADQRGDTSASDARTGGGGTDSPTTSTPVTTQPDPTAAPRDGTIFGGVVKVRTGPGTGYGEVMTLRNEEGSAVRVTGPVERGWFPVSIHGEPGHYTEGSSSMPSSRGSP